jgi:hypothetical protein
VISHNCETDRAEFFFQSLSSSSSEEIALTRAGGRLQRTRNYKSKPPTVVRGHAVA